MAEYIDGIVTMANHPTLLVNHGHRCNVHAEPLAGTLPVKK
jgi:hypothetical protein